MFVKFLVSEVSKLFRNKDGATAIEYALIAALIAVALITAVTTLGTSLSNTFQSIVDAL